MSPSKKPAEPTAAADDQRQQFLAALEAKKHRSGHGASVHESGTGPTKDHASREGGKREFRRKSGG